MIEEKIETLFTLFETNGGNEYIGEPVTIIEHSLQSGQLAKDAGEEDWVVLSAFFHDIGHLMPIDATMNMDGRGHLLHEVEGANLLRSCGFPEKMALLVQYHVQAKRYLTYKYPAYYNKLSEASKLTLGYQGGVMTEQEAERFEDDPLFKKSLQLRAWDEQAKEIDKKALPLSYYKSLAISILVKTKNK